MQTHLCFDHADKTSTTYRLLYILFMMKWENIRWTEEAILHHLLQNALPSSQVIDTGYI